MNNCTKCQLSKYRRNIVQGRGSLPCDICIIGEAPGNQEDIDKKAFVGGAGQLLDRLIKDAIELSYKNYVSGFYPDLPDKSYNNFCKLYFTNTVFCRPCDGIGQPNREPTAEEIFLCSENVQSIIDKTEAKHFILCGNIAEKYMKNRVSPYIKIMHPSAILRHGGIGSSYYLQELHILQKLFLELMG